MVKAQEWLDKNYPCNCNQFTPLSFVFNCPRNKVEELDFRNLDLEGDLYLSNPFLSTSSNFMNSKEFGPQLKRVYVSGNPRLGEIKKSIITEIIYQNPQEWLNHKYPQKEQVKEIDLDYLNYQRFEQPNELIIEDYPNLKEIKTTKGNVIYGSSLEMIDIINKVTISNCSQLEKIDIREFWNNQNLILYDLPNLKELVCHDGKLITLDLTNFLNLQTVICTNNQLAEIKFPLTAGEKLEILDLKRNNFNQDLSFLRHLVNLKSLELGNPITSQEEKFPQGIYNRFYGSLEPLGGMTGLRNFDISNTDIDSGLEYLPESLKVQRGIIEKQITKNRIQQGIFAKGDISIEGDVSMEELKAQVEVLSPIKSPLKVNKKISKTEKGIELEIANREEILRIKKQFFDHLEKEIIELNEEIVKLKLEGEQVVQVQIFDPK